MVRIGLNSVEGWFLADAKSGALNSVWAAGAERGNGRGKVRSGGYYVPVGVEVSGSWESRDEGLAKKLWEWTDGVLAEKGFL